MQKRLDVITKVHVRCHDWLFVFTVFAMGPHLFHHSDFIWTASSEFGAYRLCIRAVSPEPPPLAHTSSESRGTFRQKARSLSPLNVWACAVKICHDGMLEDTNSLDGTHLILNNAQ